MQPAAATARPRLDRWIALAIFAATLALRLMFLLRSPDAGWPHSTLYEGDAPVWVQWAAQVRAGQPFEDDLAFRTPGVSFPLAWLGLTTPPFTTAKVLWCVMSAATPAALWLVMARRFSRLAAAVAVTLLALGFGSFAIATSLNNETPYALLLTLLAGATLSWTDRPATWKAVAIGLMHGLAMLLRAEHLLLMWMLLAFMAWRWWRATPRHRAGAWQCAIALGATLLTCLPWSLRGHAAAERFNTVAPAIDFASARPRWTPEAIDALQRLPAFARASNFAFISHLGLRGGWPAVDAPDVAAFFEREWAYAPEPIDTWCLVSFKGALDFAASNHPKADGGFSRAALSDSHDRDPPFNLARPSHLQLVNHGWRLGWRWIAADPGRWLSLEGEKLRRFGDGITLGLGPSDWPHAPRMIRQSVDIATPRRGDAVTWEVILSGLLLLGLITTWRTSDGGIWLLVLAYRIAVVLLFYGYARHAVSIAPALDAMIGIGVAWVATLAAAAITARWPRATVALPALGIALLTAATTTCAIACWNPPIWKTRPAMVGDRLNPSPEWGTDAFEAVDPVALDAPR
jgi:hypothetical protein